MIDTLNKQLAGNNGGQRGDLLKWLLVALLLIAGVVGGFFLVDQSKWYQTALWLVIIGASGALASLTTSGAQLLQFFKEARQEIRKVVWPTRQETIQAALMVLVAVVVMSLLLWGIDMVLFRIVNFLVAS